VVERFEQMKKERLRLAFFVALELGGKRGEVVEALFLRGHARAV